MFVPFLSSALLALAPQSPTFSKPNVVERAYRPVAELRAPIAEVFENFGAVLSVDGNTLVVGAPAPTGQSPARGSVHVFERSPSGWQHVTRIAPPPAVGSDMDFLFAWSVDLQGDRLAVGWPARNSGAEASVIIYERNYGGPNGWGLTQRIDYPVFRPFSLFGKSVQWLGAELFVGAAGDPNSSTGYFTGNVQQFSKVGAGGELFIQTEEIDSPGVFCDDYFGWSIAAEGDRMLVGAPAINEYNCPPGWWPAPPSAYSFIRTTGGWTLEQELAPTALSDYYGHAVAMEGDVAAVAYVDLARQGHVRMFKRTGSTWTETADLSYGPGPVVTGGPVPNLSLQSGELAVGVPEASQHGRVLFYRRNEGGPDNWGRVQALEPWNGVDGDRFGTTVKHAGHTIFVGAPGRGGPLNADTETTEIGAVFVFERVDASTTPTSH